MEAVNMEKEKDPAAVTRLAIIKAEIEKLTDEKQELESQYEESRTVLDELTQVKKDIELTEWAIEENERRFVVIDSYTCIMSAGTKSRQSSGRILFTN